MEPPSGIMFGGQNNVPITIRLILGRGWGQGPTHSESLQAWFAHIPGLKVVMPSTARAKGLLLSSIFDDNPVVFMEHRWLHNQEGEVPEGDYRVPLGKANVVTKGTDVTIVSMSYMTIEALRAVKFLEQQYLISCELIDLRTISPLDWETVYTSVRKTGRVLVLDTGATTGSVAGEIVARIAIDLFSDLKAAPQRIALPDVPTQRVQH